MLMQNKDNWHAPTDLRQILGRIAAKTRPQSQSQCGFQMDFRYKQSAG